MNNFQQPLTHDSSFTLHAEVLTGLVSERTVLRVNEPMAKRTTLRVGGPADLFVEPASETELSRVLQYCNRLALPVFLLGRGSNLVIRDGGLRGVVISLAHAVFSQIEVDGFELRCGAGARLKAIAQSARRESVAGLEFLEGIPGSLGGALRMNAGAMGSAVFDVVQTVRVFGYDGVARQMSPDELAPAYRNCPGLKNRVATGATLIGRQGTVEDIQSKLDQFSRRRWKSQPAAPSAGCIFKNPEAAAAGKLIDELGLKGTRIGGAVVSAEHGNFIVNDGGASAAEVLELIALLKDRVLAATGIQLETEVQIVGE